MTASRQVFILDSSAFIMGFDASTLEDEAFVTPEVISEVKKGTASLKWSAAVESGRIKISSPSTTHLAAARKAAVEVGDFSNLSATDISVIALALEVKNQREPLIVTDDYSIQNVAHHLHIQYVALSTRGITDEIHWVLSCRSCHRIFPATMRYRECPECGGEIRRKPRKKTRT